LDPVGIFSEDFQLWCRLSLEFLRGILISFVRCTQFFLLFLNLAESFLALDDSVGKEILNSGHVPEDEGDTVAFGRWTPGDLILSESIKCFSQVAMALFQRSQQQFFGINKTPRQALCFVNRIMGVR
jgi:hypothetical protein